MTACRGRLPKFGTRHWRFVQGIRSTGRQPRSSISISRIAACIGRPLRDRRGMGDRKDLPQHGGYVTALDTVLEPKRGLDPEHPV